jgi:hypothetical protein
MRIDAGFDNQGLKCDRLKPHDQIKKRIGNLNVFTTKIQWNDQFQKLKL